MTGHTKNIIRILVVAGIIFTIFYLESKKPVRLTSNASNVVVNYTNTGSNSVDRSMIISEKASRFSKAKEFADIQAYINSGPLKLSDLAGQKVVLLDFWTYSCINCLRTTPYLNAWYEKYKDKGFVILGVHTPEFEFEKDYNNVSEAVKKFGIQYPVVLDNDYGTWNAYGNL